MPNPNRIPILSLFALLFAAACNGTAPGTPEGPAYVPPEGTCTDPDGCYLPCVDSAECEPGFLCIKQECRPAEDLNEDGDKTPDGDLDGESPLPLDGDDETSETSDLPYDGVTDVEFDTGLPHSEDNPWIFVDPNALEFGAAPLMDTVEKTVVVKNKGRADLVIDEAYIYYDGQTSDPELVVSSDKLPITLAQDEETILTVGYTASDLTADTDLLVIGSNDPSEPHVGVYISTDVKATGILEVEPEIVDFGTVRLGSHTRQLKIRNAGLAEMKLTTLLLEPTPSEFSLEDLPDLSSPFSIPAQQEISVTVRYDPAEALGTETHAQIRIRAISELDFEIEIPVVATACEPNVTAQPTALNYSSVAAGSSAVRCSIVINDGCWDLSISSIEIVDDEDNNYAWDGGTPAAPATLGPMEELELCVEGSPTLDSDNSANIALESDDPDQPRFLIPLSGEDLPNTCPIPAILLDSPALNNIHIGDVMSFDGTTSHDPDDGDSVQTYFWSLLTKPSGSTANFSSTSVSQPTLTPDKSGAYTVRLQVVDTYGLINCAPADFNFTVIPPAPAVVGWFQNVMTGDAIAGVYWEMVDGSTVVATSGNSNLLGEADIYGSFPSRTYTGHVPSNQTPLNGYTCPDLTFDYVDGLTSVIFFSCQPVLLPGSFRIILHWTNWQNGGADLDAHTWIPGGGHVYYNHRQEGQVKLDHDGGIQGGSPEPSPETTTISALLAGTYCFSINDYPRSTGSWRGIGAYVEIFDSNGLNTTIQGPAQGANGGWWHVFRIDGATGTISPVDQMGNSQPSCP